MNRVQFQPGLSLPAFFKHYGTEEQCMQALLRARWPGGFICPRCSQTEATVFARGAQRLWQCKSCATQTSLTSGTLLAHTKLPLRIWWLAIYLVTQAKNGIAALEMARQLGVCYRTAWRLKHRLMIAMADEEASRQLTGLIQIDDAYLGGEHPGGPGEPQWSNKVPFIAAVSTNSLGHPLHMRLDVVPSFRRSTLQSWAAGALSPGAEVLSDGLTAFTGVTWAGFAHEAIVCGRGRQAAQQPRLHWVNTILGNLKTAFSGTHHALKVSSYASRYLRAHAYRFNRRFDLPAMIPDLACALLRSRPSSERKLREATETRR
jgi:ribosomal protein L37AE/L43A